jgi:small-conductance mechanosensitive channel
MRSLWRWPRLSAWFGFLLAAVLTCSGVQAGWTASKAAADPAAQVTLNGHPILTLHSAAGAQSPQRLAARLSDELTQLADQPSFDPASLGTSSEPPYVMVGIREANGNFRPLMAIDGRAAKLAGLSQQQLADRYANTIKASIGRYRTQRSPTAWLRGTALALVVLILYGLLLRLVLRLNRRAAQWLQRHGQDRLPELRLGSNRLVSRAWVLSSVQLARAVLLWLALALLTYLLLPLLLGLFPPTMLLAAGLRAQMVSAAQQLGSTLVGLIPNLLALALITAFTVIVLRLSRWVFDALEQQQLQFSWFYPEWARPTARIVTLLIVVAAVALALPYVPGSTSRAFQGAGVFLGILAALGSSAIATNVLSGLMLIYTRGFREGDRVSINGVVGTVAERALLVTRILTPLNELVSIPNAMVIANPVINYSLSARELSRPVALAVPVTLGYDVPWRQAHALLLAAARQVDGILEDPSPVVVQISLNDMHVSYELNACIADAQQYRTALSALIGAVQDRFAIAGVELLSPAYEANRDGNAPAIPPAAEP